MKEWYIKARKMFNGPFLYQKAEDMAKKMGKGDFIKIPWK